jgi:hypothetical protein
MQAHNGWDTMKRKWIGPLKIDELLNQVVATPSVMPPPSNSVYLVSRKHWKNEPDAACEPLYMGGNTSTTERFRTRVGDLIADMFGFYSKETGHSSGGKSLHKYCESEKVNPKELYIGWLSSCDCGLFEEALTNYEELHPMLAKIRPPRCTRHVHKS